MGAADRFQQGQEYKSVSSWWVCSDSGIFIYRCPTDIWTVKNEVQKRGESYRLVSGRILEVIIEAMNVNRASRGE